MSLDQPIFFGNMQKPQCFVSDGSFPAPKDQKEYVQKLDRSFAARRWCDHGSGSASFCRATHYLHFCFETEELQVVEIPEFGTSNPSRMDCNLRCGGAA